MIQKLTRKTIMHLLVVFLAVALLSPWAKASDSFINSDEVILEIENSLLLNGMPTGSAPPVSVAGEGRLYFNSDDGEFKISEDGAAYEKLGGDFSDGGDTDGSNRTLGNNDSFDLDLVTNGNSRLTIKSDGKVGVGKADPDLPFQVNGTIMSAEVDNASAAVINVDWALSNQQTVVLNQVGHTLNFSNVFAGQIFRLVICQDGVGSRTITTYPSSVKFSKGVTSPNLSTDPNSCDVMSFIATDAAGIPGSLVILATLVRGFEVI